MNLRSFQIVIALSVLAGCASRGPEIPSAPVNRPTPIKEPKFCVALSGGGIRSGSVSLGVLQRLHELGLLAQVEYVSAVSGGGYPVVGIIENLLLYGSILDELLDEEGRYLEEVSERSDFVGHWVLDSLAATVVGQPWVILGHHLRSGQDINIGSLGYSYAHHILRTFRTNFRDPWSSLTYASPALTEAGIVRLFGFPTPIFVTSASLGSAPPKDGHEYSIEALFELAPEFVGAKSSSMGFYPSFVSGMSLIAAGVMSGAAVDSPGAGETAALIPDWAKDLRVALGGSIILGNGNEVFLTDGGFVENTAVLPLVRHRCQRVLAVDASFDPEMDFSSYRNLKEILESSGWRVGELVPKDGNRVNADTSAWNLPTNLWQFKLFRGQAEITVDVLKLGIDKSKRYCPVITSFAHDQQDIHMCNGLTGLEQRCAFPMESTLRQKFEPSEFDAYRHLGKSLVGYWYESELDLSEQVKMSSETPCTGKPGEVLGMGVDVRNSPVVDTRVVVRVPEEYRSNDLKLVDGDSVRKVSVCRLEVPRVQDWRVIQEWREFRSNVYLAVLFGDSVQSLTPGACVTGTAASVTLRATKGSLAHNQYREAIVTWSASDQE